MDEIKINPTFRQLMPPLQESEYTLLEASIVEHGIEEPLYLWRNFIIDGHNRYEIAQKHDLSYAVIDRSFDFDTEQDVLQWIYERQLGRRNLHDNVRTEIIGRYYELIKAPVGNPQLVQSELISETPINIEDEPVAEQSETVYEMDEYSQVPPPSPRVSRTKAAHTYGVSESKIHRASKYVRALDQTPIDIQQAARAGHISQAEVIRQSNGTEKVSKPKFDKKEMKRLVGAIAFEVEALADTFPDTRGACDTIIDLCRTAQEYTGV